MKKNENKQMTSSISSHQHCTVNLFNRLIRIIILFYSLVDYSDNICTINYCVTVTTFYTLQLIIHQFQHILIMYQ